MASHRPSPSLSNVSNNNLTPPPRTSTPGHSQQRRMTTDALPVPPPTTLDLVSRSHVPHPKSKITNLFPQPEPVYGQRELQHSARPPSPLRNGFVPTFADPVDSDDDEDWGPDKYKSTSPAASVTQFATNLATRVNSLLASPPSRSTGMLTDAELEAEAERERDLSRREAERILTQEANERKAVEERVLALMNSSRGSPGNGLPPPPPRSQTMPNPTGGPPSPSASQKESGWWAAAKNKLTPTKEKDTLTPAQQVIHEAKAREKDVKKNGKGKDKEWTGDLTLSMPATIPRKPPPASPSSPTPPFRGPPELTPSPMRPGDAVANTGSPSRETPPLYAQFNGQGTLDVPGTLLVIARRFEKLEKWSVGHVRALEERMSDVERWLVEKEKEKERDKQSLSTLDLDNSSKENRGNAIAARGLEEIHELREEITELQGRVGELGREMAQLATAPENLSNGPSRSPAIVPPPLTPQQSSAAAVSHHVPVLPPLHADVTTPRRVPSLSARDSTSPPLISSTGRGSASRNQSRLPRPNGDYATPPNSGVIDRGSLVSPPNSPPSSLPSTKPLNIPGLPKNANTASSLSSSVSSYGSLTSGLPRAMSISPSNDLPPPKLATERNSSVSPTPRKRYTVALGGPIMDRSNKNKDFTSSPVSASNNESEDTSKDETIGRSAARSINSEVKTASPSTVSAVERRLRTQSAYMSPSPSTLTNSAASPSSSPSLNRFRSRSTDRLGLGINNVDMGSGGGNEAGGVFSGGKFVDPLVLRRQSKDMGKGKVATGGGVKKVPVGQLVAFFDGDRKT